MEAPLGERGGKRLGIGNDLRRILLERGIEGLSEADGLRGDHVLQGAALRAREERLVYCFRVLGAAENEPAARPAKRLVSCRGDDVRVRHRRWMHTGGNEPREVR